MKILVAEDDPVTRLQLQRLLERWSFEVVTAENGESAWSALNQRGAPQLAILDWMMPGMTGVELCKQLRERGADEYVYVLLLTARSDSEDVLTGFEAGVDDYLPKPVRALELGARLRVGQRIVELHNRLLTQATIDALTGVWNRRAVVDALDREAARTAREHLQLAVVLADIDHFKQVNDRFGHVFGDGVLREVAGRMAQELRIYDGLGRYGGEEFLIVLPNCAAAEAVRVVERLRAAIAERSFRDGDTDCSVTTSFGVAMMEESVGSAQELLRRADAALYTAKRNGRNRVEVFTPEEGATTSAEMDEVAGLDRARQP